MKGNNYLEFLKKDMSLVKGYYLKSKDKTQQQLFLEQLIKNDVKNFSHCTLADLCCGAGTCSYHLQDLFRDSQFHLLDYNADAIELAKEICPSSFNFIVGDAKNTGFTFNSYDLVVCLMSIMIMDKEDAIQLLKEVIRILKPGGRAYFSSLFNIHKDTDLFTTIVDHTRPSGQQGFTFNYNTYSEKTIRQEIGHLVTELTITPFSPNIDLHYDGRGIGTETITTDQGLRLQVSAGVLLNWAFLSVVK